MMIQCMTACVLAIALAVPAMAQTAAAAHMEILRQKIKADKKLVVAQNLKLTDAYDNGPVTNEKAKQLLDEYLAIDDAEAKLKSAMTPKILAALPAVKAARYVQIENKIRAAVRYELAAAIPLVE